MQLKRPKFNRANLSNDLIAGTTVALVGIPDGMAQALIANVNPIYGLYTGIVTTIVGSMTTGSSFMIISLTNALALVTGNTLGSLEGAVRIEALFTLTLMVGVVQLAFGLFRLGGLTRFVSDSVMTGFIMAAAVLIILSQLRHLLGFDGGAGSIAARTIQIFSSLNKTNPETLIIGAGTMAILVALKRSPVRKFADILGILTSAVFLAVVGWASVAKVGDIAQISNSLPSLSLPNPALVPDLAAGALALAILGLTQSAGISSAFPNRDGKRANMSRDFFSQGAANMAGSFFQAMPAGGSLSATGLSVLGGARTRWAGIFAGIIMGALVVVAGSTAEIIPLAALGGLLIVAGSKIIADRWPHAVRTWQVSKISALAMAATFIVAIVVSLQMSIYVGVFFSLLLHAYSSATRVSLVELVPAEDGGFKEQPVPERLPSSQITILQIRGNFYFASVYALESELPSTEDTEHAVVILRLRGHSSISTTFLNWLRRYRKDLESTGSRLMLVGVEAEVIAQLERTGFIDELGAANVFPAEATLQESLGKAQKTAGDWLDATSQE